VNFLKNREGIIFSILPAFAVLFFLFPYLYLWTSIPLRGIQIDFPQLLWVLKQSLIQSSFSVFLTVIFAIPLVAGLLYFTQKSLYSWKKVFEHLVMLPNYLPTLFVLLSLLDWLRPFPMGIFGVALVHGFMNAGLVAVYFVHIVELKTAGMSVLAEIESASWLSWTSVMLRYLKKDIFFLLFFVFAICFSSFAVPLIVGAGRGVTLELMVFEVIHRSSDMSQALYLSLVQSVFLLLFSWLRWTSFPIKGGNFSHVFYWGHRWGVLFLLVYVGIFTLPFVQSWFFGWPQVQAVPGLLQQALNLMFPSFVFSFVVGWTVSCVMYATAFLLPSTRVLRFLTVISAPSLSLVGLMFLMLNPTRQWSELEWVLGFIWILVPMLVRLGWGPTVAAFDQQVLVAESLGASRWKILKWILIPQLSGTAAFVGSVAALWSLGDFGLSRFIFSQQKTLGMFLQSLMSSYHLDQALCLSSLLLVLSFFLISTFAGIAYVSRGKFGQRI
jgi:thiamine transport system permease protein